MSLAMKYAMKKKMAKGGCMADGGEVGDESDASKIQKSMRKAFNYAEGGDAEGSGFSDDMVSRIMKHRYSEGGKVANDTDMSADAMPNEFDDLVLDDDLEFHETGANSGDEIGDEQEDYDRKDIVKRIMKSRGKKDKMPRPA